MTPRGASKPPAGRTAAAAGDVAASPARAAGRAATGAKAGEGVEPAPATRPAPPGTSQATTPTSEMTSCRVVGLDLSITSTGICRPDGSTKTIKTNPKDGDRRLQFIVDHIGVALDETTGSIENTCDLVAIEEAPPGLKGDAIKVIHMLHGAVRLLLIDFRIPYVVINPTLLKGYATGSTRADKTDMALAAFKRAGREFTGDKGGDQCDAWWLRAAALDHLGHPESTLPQANRAYLGKVDWPGVPL